MSETPLVRAIAKLGGQSALARLVGVSQPAVWGWVDKGKALPAEHVLKVEAETGISRHELRPDIFGEVGSISEAATVPPVLPSSGKTTQIAGRAVA